MNKILSIIILVLMIPITLLCLGGGLSLIITFFFESSINIEPGYYFGLITGTCLLFGGSLWIDYKLIKNIKTKSLGVFCS